MSSTRSFAPRPPAGGSEVPAQTALLAEYSRLGQFIDNRLGFLNALLPIAMGLLTVTFSGLETQGVDAQLRLAVGIVVAVWLTFRATVIHAQSLEDALSYTEDLEIRINEEIGKNAMRFQSTHPSSKCVGGRTGQEAVVGTLFVGLLLVTGCTWFIHHHLNLPKLVLLGIDAGVLAIALDMVVERLRLQHYCYRPAVSPGSNRQAP